MSKNALEQKLYDLLVDSSESDVAGTYTVVNEYDWNAYYTATRDWERKVTAEGKDYWAIEQPEDLTPENYKYDPPKEETEEIHLADGLSEFAYTLQNYKMVTVPGFGTFEHVDSYGGEGEGESYWEVFKFTSEDGSEEGYFKLDGYYQSYDGGYYDELYQVYPKQVEVTQWSSEA